MKKKTFCEAESAIKSYLKIAANLLHGGKHAVDEVEVELIPWSNNEHSMCYDYCHIGHIYIYIHNGAIPLPRGLWCT